MLNRISVWCFIGAHCRYLLQSSDRIRFAVVSILPDSVRNPNNHDHEGYFITNVGAEHLFERMHGEIYAMMV